MAATRLIPMHVGKGKSIRESITDRVDYAENPDKTNGGEYVSSYQCDYRTADMEFLLSKRQYAAITGRSQGSRDVIAYQLRQSFKPGEITPELANEIGYKLAMAFTKGKHQFIVATHIDKEHIHNHIIFNSTSLNCKNKFRNFFNSSKAIQKLSDHICLSNGLSIIENPKRGSRDYGKWLGDRKPLTWREKLQQAIDDILKENPNDLTDFIAQMKALGYEVKQGKHLAFRSKDGKQFIRCDSLPSGYRDNDIIKRIEGKFIGSDGGNDKGSILNNSTEVNLLIDLQSNLKAKSSPGYEQWAKVFNLKQAAQTLIFLQENELTDYDKLTEQAAQATKEFNELSKKIKEKEKRMTEISALQKYISQYSRTRDVYIEYRKAGYSKKFLSENEGDIILHQAAKKFFDTQNVKKLPLIKDLKTEYAALLAEKKKMYSGYKEARENMRQLSNAKANADVLLDKPRGQNGKDYERGK